MRAVRFTEREKSAAVGAYRSGHSTNISSDRAMPNYKGRRKGTRRIVIWSQGKPLEWVVVGSKADGDKFEAEQRLKLQANKLTKRAAPTMSAFCVDHYRPYAETNLRASTWKNVRVYQVATLLDFFGRMKLTEIDFDAVESFKRVRLQSIVANTVNAELRVLSSILAVARDAGFPASKPKIVKLRVHETRAHAWTLPELQRVFAMTRDMKPWLLPLVLFLANTGCRRGEGIAAEWSWIDFARGMISIPANEFWRPKSGKPREIPLSDSLRAALSGPRRSEQWVFPKLTGERYTDFPKDLFEEIRDAAKVKGGAHTLRHTFASFFLQKQPDLFLLGKILGQSTQRVTELYTHLLPDHLRRARNAVNLAPTLKTMAKTMAKQSKRSKTLLKKKTHP